jgi:hypothetical protein
VDLIDAAAVGARRRGSSALDDDDLAAAFARRSGVPRSPERAELCDRLKSRVAGQDAAVEGVAATIARRPRGAWFVFAGPHGVGRRRLAHVLSEILYGTPAGFHALDPDGTALDGRPGLLFCDGVEDDALDALRALHRAGRLDGWNVVLNVTGEFEDRAIGFARVPEPESFVASLIPRDLAEKVDATIFFHRPHREALNRILELMVLEAGAPRRTVARLRPKLAGARSPADVKRLVEEHLAP